MVVGEWWLSNNIINELKLEKHINQSSVFFFIKERDFKSSLGF